MAFMLHNNRRLWNWLAGTLAGLVLGGLMAVVLAVGYIKQQGVLSAALESQLPRLQTLDQFSQADITIQIGRAELAYVSRPLPLQLVVHDIRLQSPEISITLPEARFGFSWQQVWQALFDSSAQPFSLASFIPKEVILYVDALPLGIVYDPATDQWQADASTANLIQFVGGLAGNGRTGKGGEANGVDWEAIPLNRFSLRGAMVNINHPAIPPLTIDTGNFNAWRSADGLMLQVILEDKETEAGNGILLDDIRPLLPSAVAQSPHSETLTGGVIREFRLDGQALFNTSDYTWQARGLAVTAEMAGIGFDGGAWSIDRLVGNLAGEVDFVINDQGTFDYAKLLLALRDASLTAKYSGVVTSVPSIEFAAELGEDTLYIRRIVLDAGDKGRLMAAADIALRNGKPSDSNILGGAAFGEMGVTPQALLDNAIAFITSRVRGHGLENKFVTDLWPDGAVPTTRNWLRARLGEGVLNDFKLTTSVDITGNKARRLAIDGSGRITSDKLRYLDGMPLLENAEVQLNFDGSHVAATTTRIDMLKGAVAGLDTKGSHLLIVSKHGVAQAALEVEALGEFGRAMEVLDSPRLNVLAPRGVGAVGSSGIYDMSGSIKWQLRQSGGIERDDFAINMFASVENATVPHLLDRIGVGLDQGRLAIRYHNGSTVITGRGKLEDTPAILYFQEVEGVGVDLAVSFPDSEEFAQLISQRSPLQLSGSTSGRLNIDQAPNLWNAEAALVLDLQNSGFVLAPISVSKPRGAAADLRANIILREGKVAGLHDLAIDSDVLEAHGQLDFADGGFDKGSFARIAWDGYDFRHITLEATDSGRLYMTGTSDVVDLRPLRQAQNPDANGLALDINLTANRLILDEGEWLSGNVTLATETNGSGRAEFLGTLYVNDKPFMSEANFTADYDKSGERVSGDGLIDGAETSLTITTATDEAATGGRNLHLKTSDAGQVLRSLNITEDIRGGSMTLDVHYPGDSTDHFTADVGLSNFRVIEAPTAVQALSVFSLTGLYSWLGGNGTYFSTGEAKIEVTPTQQKIYFARASSNALAIEITGLINPTTGEVNISGILLPVYGLTYLLGYVPLIGQLLTGLDNEGLFSTRFQVTGTLDNPITDISASSVAPGLLRDLFSPDWINRERNRLFEENEANGG